MEDLVQRRCEQLDDELRKNIVFSDTHRHSNEFVCRQARDAYVNTVEPVLNALDEFGKSEAHRAQRVRWACAKVLSMLGVGWIVAHHFVTAQETFEAALPMARGTALEKKLQEQIDENAHRVDYEQRRLDIAGSRRTKTYVVPASNVGGAPTEGRRMVPPNPGAGYGVVTAPRPKVRKPFFTFGEGNGRWGWALAVLVITVLRVLSSVSRDSDRNRNYTPPVPVRTFEQVDAQERLRIAQERNRAPQARPNAPRTSYDRTPAAEDPSRKKRAWEDVSPTGANSPYARQREPNEQRPTPSTPQRSPAAPRAPSAAPSGKR
jgi:hypothetical protein